MCIIECEQLKSVWIAYGQDKYKERLKAGKPSFFLDADRPFLEMKQSNLSRE